MANHAEYNMNSHIQLKSVGLKAQLVALAEQRGESLTDTTRTAIAIGVATMQLQPEEGSNPEEKTVSILRDACRTALLTLESPNYDDLQSRWQNTLNALRAALAQCEEAPND